MYANSFQFFSALGPLNENWFDDLDEQFVQDMFSDSFCEKTKVNVSRLVLYYNTYFSACKSLNGFNEWFCNTFDCCYPCIISQSVHSLFNIFWCIVIICRCVFCHDQQN